MKANIIKLSLLSLIMIAQVAISKDFTKLLPQENTSTILKSASSIPNNWKEFSTDNSKWFLSFDKQTGLPTTAFGQPIKISGFNTIDESNIQAAVNDFLQQNKKFFNIEPTNLSRRKLVKVKNTWAISFAQLYNGIEVLLTNVEFKIRDDGNIIAFSVKYYNNIDIKTSKLISGDQAKASAIQGMNLKSTGNMLESDSKLYIIPLIYGNNTSFAQVYKYLITDGSDVYVSKWNSYVDANTGDLLWRKPLILDGLNKLQNSVKKSVPQDEETIVPLADCVVSTNSHQYTTNKNGEFTAEFVKGQTYSFGFSGPWCFVNIFEMTQVPNSFIIDTVSSEELIGLKKTMDTTNSKLDERYLFYYTNEAHDFYTETDPDSKAMDFQCLVRTTYQGSPNASSDLATGNIYFYNTNNNSVRFIETPSVLFHEYGHSANQRLYYEVGVAQGMTNLSCHEAMADLNSALILNESKVGLGAWLKDPTKFIRDIDNQNQYPKDVNGDDHITGLILAGAYWDLVKVLSIDTVRYLAQFTKKLGTPDDENIGVAFGDWFIETLTTDDVLFGDADLSNGTPHFQQILKAFNNHKIGTNLLLINSFFHIQHEDTDDIVNDYKINFKLGSELSFINSKPTNVKLVYFLNNFNTKYETNAMELSQLNWQAKIPAQPRGTTIYYYFKATEPITDTNIELYSNNDGVMFTFLVGYETAMNLDFDLDNAHWISGNEKDDAQKGGTWEWGVPIPYYYYYQYFGTGYPLQSDGDYRPSNEISGKCWATGLDNGGDSTQIVAAYIPQGRTTLESRSYDISALNNPILDYWRWFTNIANLHNAAYWVVSLSNNGGQTWVQADSTYQSIETMWVNQRIYLSNYFENLNNIKIRFIFYGHPVSQCISEAALDDVKILSGNDEIVNSVNEVNQLNISSYPNPVFSDVTLNYISYQYGSAKITLYNILGEKIEDLYNGYINQGSFSQRFDLSNYTTGIYFIRINHNGETSSMRIVKQ
ncbi:MAG: T9SS type A sorting domain-containing protein [bacterium]